MPKILDLLYRVRDEASAALAKIRGEQDAAKRSTQSLRESLKDLKATYTEIRSVVRLAQQAYEMIESVVNDSIAAYKKQTEEALKSAEAHGKVTAQLEAQSEAIRLHTELAKADAQAIADVGKWIMELDTRIRIANELRAKNNDLIWVTNQMIDDEIALRKQQLAATDAVTEAEKRWGRVHQGLGATARPWGNPSPDSRFK